MTNRTKITLAAIPLLLLLLVLSAKYVVVEVQEAGEDGVNLVLPIPLAAAHWAAFFVPEESLGELHRKEITAYLPAIRAFLQQLEHFGDAELVTVREADNRVHIALEDGLIRIAVDDAGDRIRLRVPLSVASDILLTLEESPGKVRPASLVGALRGLPRGELVHVREPNTEVRISVW